MATDAQIETRLRALQLDSTLLELGPEEEAFFKSETGIEDTEELRKHIIEVQADAYKVYPYPCICGFRFTNLKIARMPIYPRVLGLGKNRPGAILLDVGCCLGTEARKVIRDGWPISHVVSTDLRAGFWDAGHRLFRTTPETYPAKFLAGDVFDDGHLSLTAAAPPVPSGPPPPVGSVRTLTELRGQVSVIYASSLFHIFDEERQLELGKRLAALLDRRPGSVIFGSHLAMPAKGERHGTFRRMFCHSPESWARMWEEQIFEKGQVKVETILREKGFAGGKLVMVFPAEEGAKSYVLVWSIERL